MENIIYRAWNKTVKKFTYFGTKEPNIEYTAENKLGMFLEATNSVYLSAYEEPQMYTGLKDKKLDKIFDGDIVEINGHKYFIQFEIGSFMLVRYSDETDMYEQFENCWNDDVYPLSQFYWDSNAEDDVLYDCEIVGHKYKR